MGGVIQSPRGWEPDAYWTETYNWNAETDTNLGWEMKQNAYETDGMNNKQNA